MVIRDWEGEALYNLMIKSHCFSGLDSKGCDFEKSFLAYFFSLPLRPLCDIQSYKGAGVN